MTKILVVTSEPPPTSSGLGTLWGKLAQYSSGVTFDFLGPAPGTSSPFGTSGFQCRGTLHDLGTPPASRRLAVRRNASAGLRRALWSLLYLPFYALQRRAGSDPYADWMERRIKALLPRLLAEARYDAVLVHTPPFRLAAPVCAAAETAGVPFILAVGDPIGYRDGEGGFQPEQPDEQQRLIDAAALFVTTRPTLDRYYAKTFSIAPGKCLFFSDCFVPEEPLRAAPAADAAPLLMHWGMVSPWRPIDVFARALAAYNRQQPAGAALRFHVAGKIEGPGRQEEVAAALGSAFSQSGLCAYPEARRRAAAADYFLISVSRRHMDNIPSKLIDLMSFGRPMLVLAAPGSECAKEVLRLGIGTVADPDDQADMERALTELVANRELFRRNYARPELHAAWSCRCVAEQFSGELARRLTRHSAGHKTAPAPRQNAPS